MSYFYRVRDKAIIKKNPRFFPEDMETCCNKAITE